MKEKKNKTICPFMSHVLVLQSKAELHTVDCAKETCELWNNGCTMRSKTTETTELYRWVAVMDEFTCNECAALHGMTFNLSQKNVLLHPPLHDEDGKHSCACRCSIEKVNDDED